MTSCQNPDKILTKCNCVRTLIEQLELAGIEITDGGSVLLVRPVELLTAEQSDLVRANRDAILEFIRAESDYRVQDQHVLRLMATGALDTKPSDFAWRNHDSGD